MILFIILMVVYGVASVLTSPLLLLDFIPNFSVTSGLLPFGTDAILVSAMSMFKAFMTYFPPLVVVYGAAKVYLGFEIIMFFLRLALGHRLKDHPTD